MEFLEGLIVFKAALSLFTYNNALELRITWLRFRLARVDAAVLARMFSCRPHSSYFRYHHR